MNYFFYLKNLLILSSIALVLSSCGKKDDCEKPACICKEETLHTVPNTENTLSEEEQTTGNLFYMPKIENGCKSLMAKGVFGGNYVIHGGDDGYYLVCDLDKIKNYLHIKDSGDTVVVRYRGTATRLCSFGSYIGNYSNRFYGIRLDSIKAK